MTPGPGLWHESVSDVLRARLRAVSIDRILEPAMYAEAGIPHFWRIEFQPELNLTA